MTSEVHPVPSRAKMQLIAALLALSTVLFVVGVAVERGWGSGAATVDIHQEAGASREAAEGTETQTEAKENAEASEAQAHDEAAELGIASVDLESPWVVAAIVALTALLIAALRRFGHRVLFLVLVVTMMATIADVREIFVQAGQMRYGVAALATGVAVARLATVIVTWLAMGEDKTSAQPPALSA